MKNKSWIGFLALMIATPLQAAFELKHASARSAAMGNSFLASANESAAVFVNPAGLAGMKSAEMSFLYGKPLAGLDGVSLGQGHAALAVPTGFGHIGLGYAAFQAQNLMAEQTLAASYATSFQRLQLGVTAKHLSHSYKINGDPLAANDPVFANGTSKSALTFDAGAVMPLGKFMKAGVAVRNMNSPDVGLASEDHVSREVQAGLALDLAGTGLKVAGDVFMRQSDPGSVKNQPIPFLGLEKSLAKNTLALRLGANTLEYTGGIGFRLGHMSFDYAMVMPRNLLGDGYGTHKMGMSYRFSKLK